MKNKEMIIQNLMQAESQIEHEFGDIMPECPYDEEYCIAHLTKIREVYLSETETVYYFYDSSVDIVYRLKSDLKL